MGQVGSGGSMEGILFNGALSSAELPGVSQTLPGTSSSQQVTGLELGTSYLFSLIPVRDGVRGPEASITQSPGRVGTAGGTTRVALGAEFLGNSAPLPVACPRGLMDVVFLVHATRDNAHRSEAVKRALEHLVSALGPLGPQAIQVWPQRQPDSGLSLPTPGPHTIFLPCQQSRFSCSPSAGSRSPH